MALLWLPEAKADVGRLFDFLYAKNPNAAARAIMAIREGADRLQGFPEIGRPMNDGTPRRELFIPFGGGQYVIRYRIDGGNVVVIRVWHSREHRH